MGAGELGLVAFVLFVLFGASKVGGKKKSSPKTSESEEEKVAETKEERKEKPPQITHRSA